MELSQDELLRPEPNEDRDAMEFVMNDTAQHVNKADNKALELTDEEQAVLTDEEQAVLTDEEQALELTVKEQALELTDEEQMVRMFVDDYFRYLSEEFARKKNLLKRVKKCHGNVS
jgi:hypothetical protein